MIRCASCGANYIIGAHQGRPRVPHYRCGARSSAGAVVCSNRVTVSAPALEKRVTEMLDVVVKSPKQLEALVAEHNKKISSANEVQLASVRALEIRQRDLDAQKARLIDAIKQGIGAVSILVGELDKCAQELDGIAKRIESLRVLVQPLLIPRRHAVTDYISGSASLFTGDVTEDRATLEKVLEGVWVYADGSLLVQFRRESLFHPVRHVHLLPVSKTAQDDVAAARGELLKGFQEAIGTYRAGAANDLKDDIEVDIFEDADGPPAVSAMTRGSTKSTFGEGAAGPGREITRKKAFASPAGFEPLRTRGAWPTFRLNFVGLRLVELNICAPPRRALPDRDGSSVLDRHLGSAHGPPTRPPRRQVVRGEQQPLARARLCRTPRPTERSFGAALRPGRCRSGRAPPATRWLRWWARWWIGVERLRRCPSHRSSLLRGLLRCRSPRATTRPTPTSAAWGRAHSAIGRRKPASSWAAPSRISWAGTSWCTCVRKTPTSRTCSKSLPRSSSASSR
jgi:hypothetical protein